MIPRSCSFDEPHTGLDQDAAAMLDGLLRRVPDGPDSGHDVARYSASRRAADRVDILSRGVIAASFAVERQTAC